VTFASVCGSEGYTREQTSSSSLSSSSDSLSGLLNFFSWLTSCYLDSHLPEHLNPLVTHNNLKLGRCSLNGNREVEHCWVYWRLGWRFVCGHVVMHRCMAAAVSFKLMENINTIQKLYQEEASKHFQIHIRHHPIMSATSCLILNRLKKIE